MNRAQAKAIAIEAVRNSVPFRIVREQRQFFAHKSGMIIEFYPLFSVEARQEDGIYALAVGKETGRQAWFADWRKAEDWMRELEIEYASDICSMQMRRLQKALDNWKPSTW